MCSKVLGELDPERSDAACATWNENSRPVAHVQFISQRLQCSQSRQGNARRRRSIPVLKRHQVLGAGTAHSAQGDA